MKPVNRTKVNLIKIMLLIIGAVLFMGCKSSSVIVDEAEDVPSVLEENNQIEAVYKAEGLSHEPYGWDNLYGSKEVPEIWWERSPRDPVEGDVVEIAIAAWKDTADMDIWLEWSLNGEAMEAVPCMLESLGRLGKGIRLHIPYLQGLTVLLKRDLVLIIFLFSNGKL